MSIFKLPRARMSLAAALLLPPLAFAAAEEVDPAIDAGVARTEQAQSAQQQIDSINTDIQSKQEQFRGLLKEEEGLEVYIRQLEIQTANQAEEMQRLEESIDKVTVIERQITPLMIRMIDALEQFVALDMPFLKEERETRVEKLKSLIERADVTVAEKFRNVFQAYQTEIEYGRTIESYRGSLDIGGEPREVDFLRIGRIALLYQAIDGSQAAAWNPGTGQWEPLDAGYRNQIRQALRIAREQAAPDLIKMPIPTAEAAK